LNDAGCGIGIGICTGLYPGAVVGLSTGDSGGASPMVLRRSIEEQPPSSAAIRTRCRFRNGE
jgi:hypothetical protein